MATMLNPNAIPDGSITLDKIDAAVLATKQDTISDLDAIRQGAEKGSTALQSESDPIYMADKPNLALKSELDGKVDKEEGKGLSSNDYTDAEKAKLSELGQEVYDKREYGTIAGEYIMSSVWFSKPEAVSKYIKVRKDDTIRIVKNSNYQIYCAFVTSIDTSIPPTFTNGTSAVIKKDDATLQVSSECYFWWLVDYNSAEHWEPSVLTLNGQDILNETYSVSRISEIQEGLNGVQEGLNGVQEGFNGVQEGFNGVQEGFNGVQEGFGKMVGSYRPHKMLPADWGTPIEGKYWNLVDGSAGLVSASNYFARPTLCPVNPGTKMIVTVKNIYVQLGAAAFSGYDNDGLPAYGNGTLARVDFKSATSIVDNGDGTTTYTFILESSVTQVGLFYKGEEVTFYFEQNESFAYSQTLDNHIQAVAGGGATTSGDSAKYYLKGSSPKSFSSAKKICILAAGQSNIDGRVPFVDMPAEIQRAQPIANCHYVKNSQSDAFSSLNITDNWAFDLVTYYNIALNQDLYVIKWSVGGTSIDPLGDGSYHWTADYEDLDSLSKSLLLKFETEIRNHIASDGSQFDVRAMLWYQGEGDRGSLGTGSADRYYNNLRNMVSYIRGIVGNERLPIITGTISENSAQYDATIHSAQERLASEDPYFVLIDMSGAPLKDSYHFNAAASVYLGQMVYNALIDLGVISGTKLIPTRPW